tara:strand:+ start:52071 stop:53045 length:975 start_codon:yes stop_codon:yes gene_type:complete
MPKKTFDSLVISISNSLWHKISMQVKNQVNHIRFGSRSSPLAKRQAEIVASKFLNVFPNFTASFKSFCTTGDNLKDVPLYSFGGKGLFCKEVDQACIRGEIDVAVHSAKDMSVECPDQLVLAATLERSKPGDVLISKDNLTLSDLPSGAVIGTCSLRRHALVKYLRPDLTVVPIRGNVQTRLKKIHDQEIDATVLAAAGLERLGYGDDFGYCFDQNDFIPAAGQGIIAMTMCPKSPLLPMIQKINDLTTWHCFQIEQKILKILGASCQMPVGVFVHKLGEIYKANSMLSDDALNHTVFSHHQNINPDKLAEIVARDLLDKQKRK